MYTKLFFILFLTASWLHAVTIYQKPSGFLKEVFANKIPPTKLQIIGHKLQQRMLKMNGEKFLSQRVRVWQEGNKKAYILQEIGKTKPITVGVVVNNNRITCIKVLIYRESHGGEVAANYFTKQFYRINLKQNRRIGSTLSKRITPIAGATLSVNALKKIARNALLLAQSK